MKGIKPNNTQVSNSKNTGQRRLDLEHEKFLVGPDALMSPRHSQDEFGGTSKRNKVNPDDLGYSFNKNGRNYNNRHAGTSVKNGRKTNRSGAKFGLNSTIKKTSDPLNDMYIKPWKIANHDGQEGYHEDVSVYQQPMTKLNDKDYIKRLKFEQLKQTRLEAMCKWKQKDSKGHKKNAYIKQIQKRNNQILKISDKSELEKLDVYTDRFPMLGMRKSIKRFLLNIKLVCSIIIGTKLFENISLSVIIFNSLVMVVDDSATNDNPNPIFADFENLFQYLYTVEMAFKILGLGFVFGEGTYLRDEWNLLDFFIVMIGYVTMAGGDDDGANKIDEPGPQVEEGGLNVSGLRTFRVLRPLKSISSVKGLKVLIVAVLSALPMLKDTMLILMFFFIIFSIAFTQMYAGKLKQRCTAIQTGILPEDSQLCNAEKDECPGGYICAKTNENPNYGVTNWDNVAYSILTIFQFVTLEGWSEIQRDMQITSNYFFAPLLFMSVVLIGAFFLLNLTMAVINSKFTESQNKQEELDRIEAREQAQLGGPNNDNEIEATGIKDEMSIAQYINARIYAKKMIEFLRLRQAVKRIELERKSNAKVQMRQEQRARRQVIGSKSQLGAKEPNNAPVFEDPTVLSPKSLESHKALNLDKKGSSYGNTITSNGFSKIDVGTNVIVEDVQGEHRDDLSEKEQDKLDKDIQDFLLKSKIDMQQKGINTRDFRIPKTINTSAKKEIINVQNQNGIAEGGPTMKGNIGAVKKMQNSMGNGFPQNNFSKRLAEELDIDNVIPKDDQKDSASIDRGNDLDSMASFQLSLDKLVYDEQSLSQKSNAGKYYYDQDGAQTINGRFMAETPDGDQLEDSGLITSDSDFEVAAQAAGANEDDYGVVAALPRSGMNIRKDVTKAFKKMLTSNNMRTTHSAGKKADQSTMFGGSQADQDGSQQAVSFDLESKFKKKRNKPKSKAYKEDQEELGENYLQHLFDATNVDNGLAKQTLGGGASKNDIRQLQEFVSTKKPLDPFRDLNPLTHKVEINQSQAYMGTSQKEVLMPRQVLKDQNILANSNIFISRPKLNMAGKFEEDNEKQFVKNIWKPYQQKFFYKYEVESSEEYVSQNEDELQQQEQPFNTTARINYGQQTKIEHTSEICKRADVLITSTMSFNLIPKDKRKMKEHNRTAMNQDDYDEYINEYSEFRAELKEHQYQSAKIREKDTDLRGNYAKSFMHKTEFQTKTLAKFKRDVQIMNQNRKPVIVKHKDQIKQERQKHMQNCRASEKRGLPKFDMDDAKKLLDGKFHEEDEEDAEQSAKMMQGITMNTTTYGQMKHQENLARFEQELHQIFEQSDEEDHIYIDEIPLALRKEFSLPKNILDNVVDFNNIRKFDAGKKKIKPMWSGQDILPDSLDNEKCALIVNKINGHRVWPTGVFGMYKRAKFLWRIQVKSDMYDHFFTFFVFLNTITLALERYGINPDLEIFLESTNIYFTVVFIYEMFAKIGGIGTSKYLADKMNWLDGFIVMTSIFELVYTAASGDSGGASALNTLRLLRTFRVLRVMRLLRGLESMQTILNVMARSYMSFVYITMLMFLFMIIFTLLGMQLYGGYWKDDPEGLPANNYDDFLYSFFTVFQILTMENWQSILFVMNRNNTKVSQPYTVSLFLIVWIFIGNFIMLNLFLAILLDAFLVDEEELSEEEVMLLKMKKAQKRLNKKKKLEAKIVLMDTGEIKKMNALPVASNWYFGQEKAQSEEDLEDLDEEQIIAIFKEQGMIKKEKSELQNIPMFVGVHCQMSFFIFSKDNLIRIGAYKLTKHPLWETIVIILITLSSLKLAFDTFYINETEEDLRFHISNYTDLIFNYLFIFEMTCKLVAMGMLMDENSYLRDNWNQMDFFIVTASIFDMALAGLDVGALKILRMLRTLRPLRFLTHNIGMKLIVNALIGSVGGISNVFLVLAMVYLIFAILFVNLYKGTFFYCSIDTYVLHTQLDCEYAGGSWEQYDHNFDSANRAWTTLFIVASLEGWPDIFVQTVESTVIDVGPEQGQNPAKGLILFVAFIFIGSFFFLNFFIGVLFMKFNKAQEEEQKGYTDKDMAWMDIQRLILSAEPDYESTNVPKNKFRRRFHDLVSNPKFDALIMAFIMLNMVQMAMLQEGNKETTLKIISVTNYIFTVVFLIEAVFKAIAFGSTYFNNSWNKFDFFVVSASLFDVALEFMNFEAGGFLSVGPKIARVMRVLRVTRILRLAGKAESLQAILQTITFSIPALANVFFLLMLIFFMFSVLANFQFNDIISGEVIDPDYKNFKDFYSSFVLLFALTTGEDWNKVMFDTTRTKESGCVEGIDCGKFFGFPFFFMLVILCSYVMLNLFILVIIQQFEKYYLPEVNMLGMFKDDTVSFMKIWKQLTQDRYSCLKMKENQLTSFFRKLGDESESLGFPEALYDDGELKKQLLKMAIKSDNGYIFFNEMLYRCMRRKYGNMKINKKMQIFELRTQYSIYLMTLSIQNKGNMKLSNEDIFNSIIKKENGVNPFLTVMNFKISFKTWLKVARLEIDGKSTEIDKDAQRTCKVDIEVEEFLEYSSEEEDENPGSDQEGSYRGSKQDKSSKKKDKQKSFERKMTSKLKANLILRQSMQKQPFSSAKVNSNRLDTSEKKQ